MPRNVPVNNSKRRILLSPSDADNIESDNLVQCTIDGCPSLSDVEYPMMKCDKCTNQVHEKCMNRYMFMHGIPMSLEADTICRCVPHLSHSCIRGDCPKPIDKYRDTVRQCVAEHPNVCGRDDKLLVGLSSANLSNNFVPHVLLLALHFSTQKNNAYEKVTYIWMFFRLT